jgi:tRNA threonylcarbamoyladenosine biosynthesis protein TsaB
MLILACDTSNAACSACLFEDGQVQKQAFLSLGLTHSQTFMPMVHELMATSGRTYREVDAFACTVGPGSFTGIRIGVSAVKVMAMTSGKAAIPVSSLRALALPLFSEKDNFVAAAIDARNRRVFCAAYYNGSEVINEDARSADEFLRLCSEWLAINRPDLHILICGNAWGVCAAAAQGSLSSIAVTDSEVREILPSSVAFLAYEHTFMDAPQTLLQKFPPNALMPVYRAKTSAERMFPDAVSVKSSGGIHGETPPLQVGGLKS